MGLLPLFTVLLFGLSVNVHNSADQTVDDFQEAKTRIVQSVVDGYSQGEYTSYELND